MSTPKLITDSQITELERLSIGTTPGAWFWWGNADNHAVALCGSQLGLGVCEVISTLRVDRDPKGREATQMRENLRDCSGMTPEEIDEAVHEWAVDEYGYPRTDERLAITGPDFIRHHVNEFAVYEVARRQGLPDDTPRDHPKVYRADVCDVRLPNARWLAAASPTVIMGLIERLRVAESRLANYSHGEMEA